MKKTKFKIFTALSFFLLFLLWTFVVKTVDVKPIGAEGSSVGLATLNHAVIRITGVNLSLYTLTDFLSLIPLFFILSFALLGAFQWIKRKSLLKVDFDILALGIFYVLVMTTFLAFEIFIINYRPILIEGVLEASYPSSTTMLSICVMYTAGLILKKRIRRKTLNKCSLFLITVFAIFMIIARLLSGVHWFSDIVGGVLISMALIHLYRLFI